MIDKIDTFFHYLLLKNKIIFFIWTKFKEIILMKFDKIKMRKNLLWEKLNQIKYHESIKMNEFCIEFRMIEI